MLRFKVNAMSLLKAAGYPTTRLRTEKILGSATMQKIRHNEMVSARELDLLCALLKCQPGDLLEYVDDSPSDGHKCP